MLQHVILAADGSAHALRAAETLLEWLKPHEQATVTIVYVIGGETSKQDVLYGENRTEIEQLRKKRLAPTVQKMEEAGIRYEVKTLRGEPGPTIVHYANENEADLVVVGSRGLNKLQEMVLGSVSHKIAKRVNCPVLIVK